VRPDRFQPGYYNIGFELVDISNNEARIIEKIMEDYSA
jgi:hypothetical protein